MRPMGAVVRPAIPGRSIDCFIGRHEGCVERGCACRCHVPKDAPAPKVLRGTTSCGCPSCRSLDGKFGGASASSIIVGEWPPGTERRMGKTATMVARLCGWFRMKRAEQTSSVPHGTPPRARG